MNRRGFLKLAGVAVLIPALPALVPSRVVEKDFVWVRFWSKQYILGVSITSQFHQFKCDLSVGPGVVLEHQVDGVLSALVPFSIEELMITKEIKRLLSEVRDKVIKVGYRTPKEIAEMKFRFTYYDNSKESW